MYYCVSVCYIDQEDGLQPLSTKLLCLIKWIPDGETTERKLKIAETIAPKWRDVAMLIGTKIQSIQNSGSGKTPEQCLFDVLQIWEAGSNGENAEYPYTWDGLIHLLNDIDHSFRADDVRKALSSERSTVRGNLHQKQKTRGIQVVVLIVCKVAYSDNILICMFVGKLTSINFSHEKLGVIYRNAVYINKMLY